MKAILPSAGRHPPASFRLRAEPTGGDDPVPNAFLTVLETTGSPQPLARSLSNPGRPAILRTPPRRHRPIRSRQNRQAIIDTFITHARPIVQTLETQGRREAFQ